MIIMSRKLSPFSGFGMLNWVTNLIVRKGSVLVRVHMETLKCLCSRMWHHIQFRQKCGRTNFQK